MSNQELYDNVIKAYKMNDENRFAAAARNWVENSDYAPFEDGHARDLFYKAKLANKAWRSKAINGRISKTRMIERVRDIAQMDLKNPYEGTVKQEAMHVLGVLPEESKEPAEDFITRVFGEDGEK